MPDFAFEEAAGGRVAGIDEVGRGPWAGPVVAAAAILDPAKLPSDLAARVDDSKKLSRPIREMLFEALQQHALLGVGMASVSEIDANNILAATMLAMRRAVEALPIEPDIALVDGNRAPGLSLSIAAASIIAKVTRDRIMTNLAKKHPGYGWERNVGYGTKAHKDGLDRCGVTIHHRRSFKPIASRLK
jgi:ribonuclease HII